MRSEVRDKVFLALGQHLKEGGREGGREGLLTLLFSLEVRSISISSFWPYSRALFLFLLATGREGGRGRVEVEKKGGESPHTISRLLGGRKGGREGGREGTYRAS